MVDRAFSQFAELFELPLRNGLTKPKAVRGEGLKMVNMGEVFAHRRIRNLNMDRVPMDSKERASSLLRAGDLLFARQSLVLSGAGKCVLFLGDQEDATFESHIIRCRLDERKAEPAFYFYLFQSKQGRSLIEAIVEQVAAAGIRGSDLGRLIVPVPPLATQRAIAHVLGTLDDLIELNRETNEILEEMARALFKSWFVDFDPVRAKLEGRPPAGMDAATAALFPDHFQDSELGQIPKGWEVKPLGDLADMDKGLSYKGSGLADEGGMPMVNLGCFSGRGIFNTDKIKRYTGEYRERHLVHEGDLVIANTDMTQNRVIIGSPSIVPKLGRESKFIFTHHVFAVRFKPGAEIFRRYVYFTLLKPEFREIAEGFSTGTTVLALPRDGLTKYMLCLPPVALIEEFEKQAEPLLEIIHANNEESRDLATLRDTLLPKLLSGEIQATSA